MEVTSQTNRISSVGALIKVGRSKRHVRELYPHSTLGCSTDSWKDS